MAGALAVLAGTPGQIVRDGLQLWLDPSLYASYPGSGTNCYDLSANGYTTTLQRGITLSTARAPSFVFNGATNYRYIEVGQYLNYDTFTLSSWFKSSVTSTYQMLFSKEQAGGSPWNYRMYLAVSSGVIVCDVAQSGSESVVGSTNLCDGVWHNAVFVRSTALSTIYCYVDGQLISSSSTSLSGSVGNNRNVWIGVSAYTGAGASGSYPMNGNIGQSLIYNTALTANQVKQNFAAMRAVYGV